MDDLGIRLLQKLDPLSHHLSTQQSEVHPTPHFVPEGISSSMRDFIFLAFNFQVF